MKKNNPTNPNPSPRRFVRLRGDELDRPEALPGAVVHREVDEPVSNYFKRWGDPVSYKIIKKRTTLPRPQPPPPEGGVDRHPPEPGDRPRPLAHVRVALEHDGHGADEAAWRARTLMGNCRRLFTRTQSAFRIFFCN